MYFYIYDSFLNHKKYESLIHRIEARLFDLGLSGHIEKLTILKSIKEVVNEALKRNAETIVAVGNDHTISKIISFLPNHSVVLGIIPIGKDNKIAHVLGIEEGERACDILSARVIEKIDLGKVNNSYFLSCLEIPSHQDLVMECENYNIIPLTHDNQISICNFGNIFQNKKQKIYNPKDGLLEAVISEDEGTGLFNIFKQSYEKDSIFPIKKIKIKSVKESIPLMADGSTVVKTPVEVEVLPKKLKIIVGKNRLF